MTQNPNIIMEGSTLLQNWSVDSTPDILRSIHDNHINIAIYERDVEGLAQEIQFLLNSNVVVRATGNKVTIEEELAKHIDKEKCPLLIQDILTLLEHFSQVTNVEDFRLLLATVNTNMCRKFHTDVNDLRMLCTYSGPGTLWLTNDNIDHQAMSRNEDNEQVILDESKVQQAKTGAAIILKGAIYPYGKPEAVVHRSPTIEESGESRLLLRIDTNANLNLWS